MYTAFIILGLCTVIELFVCHFTLWWFLALIARLLYSLRVIGATFKVKRLAITEAISFACMLLWNMLFSKDNMPWARLLMFLVFGIISCLTMLIDDFYFVHVTMDAQEEIDLDKYSSTENAPKVNKVRNKVKAPAKKKKSQKQVAKKQLATRRTK